VYPLRGAALYTPNLMGTLIGAFPGCGCDENLSLETEQSMGFQCRGCRTCSEKGGEPNGCLQEPYGHRFDGCCNVFFGVPVPIH